MPVSKDLALIKEVQRKARQGEPGQLRKEFNRQYRQILENTYGEIRSEVSRYTDSTGAGVACARGCTFCCGHFISVTVSHAMVIADYLYASENAMSVFLRGYDRWLAAVEAPDAEAVFGALEEDTVRSAVVKSSSQDLLSAYHSLGVACPFLDKTRCAIYPVRPVCCAAYYSVSPPELCRADSEAPASIIQVKPSEKNLRHFAELADIRLSAHQEALPKLVYKLLTMGFSEVYLEVEKLFKAPDRTPPAGEQPSPGLPDRT